MSVYHIEARPRVNLRPLLWRCVWCLLVLCTPVAKVNAGELILTNGDRLEGSLVSMNRKEITWKSKNFGELTVAKTKVANLSLSTLVTVQGAKEPCNVSGVVDHQLVYHCGEQASEQRAELSSLRFMHPYTDPNFGSYVHRGNLSLAGSFARGNTIEDDLVVNAGASFRKRDLRHVLNMDYDSESVADLPGIEDYEFTYRLDWFIDQLWFWYNQTRWESIESANIADRYTLGSGLGVQIWENPERALALEFGLDYVQEYPENTFFTSSGEEAGTEWVSGRFATDFRYQLPMAAILFNRNELLYSLEDSSDWEVSSDLGINIPLGPGLFSEWKLEYDFDNTPLAGARSEDTRVTVGVGYHW